MLPEFGILPRATRSLQGIFWLKIQRYRCCFATGSVETFCHLFVVVDWFYNGVFGRSRQMVRTDKSGYVNWNMSPMPPFSSKWMKYEFWVTYLLMLTALRLCLTELASFLSFASLYLVLYKRGQYVDPFFGLMETHRHTALFLVFYTQTKKEKQATWCIDGEKAALMALWRD